MRKYILVVLTFMMFACTLGQRNAKQTKSEPTVVPTSVSSVAIVATMPTPQPTNALTSTRVPLSAIPAARLALLARGVNLTQWYKVASPTPFSNFLYRQ
jgi:hypothetical protein